MDLLKIALMRGGETSQFSSLMSRVNTAFSTTGSFAMSWSMANFKGD